MKEVEIDELSEKKPDGANSLIENDDETISKSEITEILLNTRELGQMTEQLIKNQIEVKDNMISKLHKELEFYKQGEADRFIDQVMKSVIKVRKDMLKNLSDDEWEEKSAGEIRKEYTYIFEDITDLLEQQNIDTYQTESGSLFDPSIHQAKLENTDDPSLDKRIKKSLGEGYRKNNKVLLPERVIVYQYREIEEEKR